MKPDKNAGEDQGQQVQSDANSLIAPFLEGLPQEVVPIVSERLTQAQQAWDSEAGKKISSQAAEIKEAQTQLARLAEFGQMEEVERAFALQDALITDPVGTIRSIAAQFEEYNQRDVLAELMEALNVETNPSGQQENQVEEKATGLTEERLLEILAERDKANQSHAEDAANEAAGRQLVTEALSDAGFSPNEALMSVVSDFAAQALQVAAEEGIQGFTVQDALAMAIEDLETSVVSQVRKRSAKLASGGRPVGTEKPDLSTDEGAADAAFALLQALQQGE